MCSYVDNTRYRVYTQDNGLIEEDRIRNENDFSPSNGSLNQTTFLISVLSARAGNDENPPERGTNEENKSYDTPDRKNVSIFAMVSWVG